jgi:hypothetical protein
MSFEPALRGELEPALASALTALQSTPWATAILEGSALFPWIETVHVLAVVTVVGTISVLDLKLLGCPAHVTSARRLMQQIIPVTWTAFAIALISGFLMFASKAVAYAGNGPFRIKMLLLLAAGINMLIFHALARRSLEHWHEQRAPLFARIAGFASLALWVSVIFSARWIGFTLV